MQELRPGTAERAIAFLAKSDGGPVRARRPAAGGIHWPRARDQHDGRAGDTGPDGDGRPSVLRVGHRPVRCRWRWRPPWLTTAWDQNTLLAEATPGSLMLDATALRWIVEAAGLPEGTWAFVTERPWPTSRRSRHARRCSQRSAGRGQRRPFGAPPVTVVVGGGGAAFADQGAGSDRRRSVTGAQRADRQSGADECRCAAASHPAGDPLSGGGRRQLRSVRPDGGDHPDR